MRRFFSVVSFVLCGSIFEHKATEFLLIGKEVKYLGSKEEYESIEHGSFRCAEGNIPKLALHKEKRVFYVK